ncbi:hypothetical protein L0U85_13075 [Glycomyces sp. L485]|uniref:hypothetical protein n=1 Tax=Glycomyces sp. L485 TaxID=2909235 RepID=UPI001F4A94FE|nr:hypothetical protein [Glycomyces sp. L485]MCH7231777.1 hypothetical protein [Glycomyces sp. L485]
MSFLQNNDYSASAIKTTSVLSENAKIMVLQQYFEHVESESHFTTYNEEAVGRLLSGWFGIELRPQRTRTATGDQRIADRPAIPGRAGNTGIYRASFGDTEIYFYMSAEKHEHVEGLIELVTDNLVLTTEATSPPCEVSEFVPLWLSNRDRSREDYYIDDSSSHHLEDYFASQVADVEDALGVRIQHPSKEMAIVANGDGLRFHRDRLVKQYRDLARIPNGERDYRLVQDLTLIDWDMQDGTVSGTAFEHPNGDRYLFPLYPGESVGMFFSEVPRFPGPMMLPYHCALPIMDAAGDKTAGTAKGKRFNTLVRGYAKADEVDALDEQAQVLDLGEPVEGPDGARTYGQGFDVFQPGPIPVTEAVAVRVVEGRSASLSLTELDAAANSDLIHAVTDASPESVSVYRVEKYSAGFSELHVIPGIEDAGEIVIVNRNEQTSIAAVRYPLAFDFLDRDIPWIQMIAMRTSACTRISSDRIGALRISPPEKVLHKPAVLDSFYPFEYAEPREPNVLDIIVVR